MNSPNAFQISLVNQVIENILRQHQGQIDPNIFNALANHYQNGRLPVADLIRQRLPNWRGQDSIDQNTLVMVVKNALNEWCEHIQKQLMSQYNPGYMGGYNIPGSPWPNPGYGGMEISRGHDSGLGVTPVTVVRDKAPTLDERLFTSPERSSGMMHTGQENNDHYSFNNIIEQAHDKYWYKYGDMLKNERIILGESESSMKRYLIMADAKDPVNSYYELLCKIWPFISGSPPQGEFIIFIDYDKMINLPIGRTAFLSLINKIVEDLNYPQNELDAGLMLNQICKKIDDMSSRIKTSMEMLIVGNVNELFSRLIRRSDSLGFNIKLDDLNDLRNLITIPRTYLSDENIKLCLQCIETITIRVLMDLLKYSIHSSVKENDKFNKHLGSLGSFITYHDKYSLFDFTFPEEMTMIDVMNQSDDEKRTMYNDISKENVIITSKERLVIQNVIRNMVPYFDVNFDRHFGTCTDVFCNQKIMDKYIIHRLIAVDETKHINDIKQFNNVLFPRDSEFYCCLEPIKDHTPGIKSNLLR